MRRREMLQATGLVLATTLTCIASARPQLPRIVPTGSTRRAFPWGVASADPQSDAVMVWTKAAPMLAGRDEQVIVQFSLDETFDTVAVEHKVLARVESDHSVRIRIIDLSPDTTYYFRFITADGAVSRTGRTWTAPDSDSMRDVLIAVASCQSYPASQYGAFRHLIQRERNTGERPDFILHLGDYVYGSDLHLPTDPATGLSGPDREPAPASPRGRPRDPAAGVYDYDAALAATRALYAKYHLDRDLQDARALYPFVTIWDDHEFGNDVWQSFSGAGGNPVGRMAATQVWSEWVPQVVSESQAIGGVPNQARDFRRAPVASEPLGQFDDDYLARNQQNLNAIGAMTGYRSIRWGKLVDLILTDNRSYRGPGSDPRTSVHGAMQPTAQQEAGFGGSAEFPLFEGATLDLVAEGRFANGGSPPASITDNGRTFANPRRDAPRVSMLGQRQKSWFKDALRSSEARWKIWANPEPITGFKWDIGKVRPELGQGYSWFDAWDGFPNERRELLRYMRQSGIANVVSLAGDRHAHFAALVADDHDAAASDYVIPEFTCSGISAFARATNLGARFDRLGIGRYAWASPKAGAPAICTLDTTLTGGVAATDAMLAGADADTIKRLAAAGPNPHIRHSDMDSQGYLLARFTQDAARIEFVTMPRKPWDPVAEPKGPEALRLATFEVPAWNPGEQPVIKAAT